MMARALFPPRRQSYVGHLTHQTIGYRIGFSFLSPDSLSIGKVREIFVSCDKPGSELEALARDAAIAISLGLQHGVPLEEFASSLTRGAAAAAAPATLIGAVIDFVLGEAKKIEADWARVKAAEVR
jgi:hypothetical protein